MGGVLEVTEMRLQDTKPSNRLRPHHYSGRALRRVSDRHCWPILEFTKLTPDLQRLILSFCERTPSAALLFDHFTQDKGATVNIPPPLVQRLTNRFRIILEPPPTLTLGVCRFQFSSEYEPNGFRDHTIRLHIRQMERKVPQWQFIFKCQDYSDQWGPGDRHFVDQEDLSQVWVDVFSKQELEKPFHYTFTVSIRYLSKRTGQVVELFSHTPYDHCFEHYELMRLDYCCEQAKLATSQPMRVFEQILF